MPLALAATPALLSSIQPGELRPETLIQCQQIVKVIVVDQSGRGRMEAFLSQGPATHQLIQSAMSTPVHVREGDGPQPPLPPPPPPYNHPHQFCPPDSPTPFHHTLPLTRRRNSSGSRSIVWVDGYSTNFGGQTQTSRSHAATDTCWSTSLLTLNGKIKALLKTRNILHESRKRTKEIETNENLFIVFSAGVFFTMEQLWCHFWKTTFLLSCQPVAEGVVCLDFTLLKHRVTLLFKYHLSNKCVWALTETKGHCQKKPTVAALKG